MKKRLLVFVLALSIVMSMAMPAFADNTIVSEDSAVQEAYDTYVAIKAAFDAENPVEIDASFEKLDAVTVEFTDSQSEEWTAVVENEIGFEEYIDTVINAAYVCTVNDSYEAFVADKNAATALTFTEIYSVASQISDVVKSVIDKIEGVMDAYTEAIEYLPSEKVMSVYDAYSELQYGLLIGSGEDLKNSIEIFGAVVETFNELDENEMSDLALLLEVEDRETAYSQILSDWIDANILYSVEQAYTAFIDEANEENSQTFVDTYDGLFNDESYEDEEMRALIRDTFTDIDEVYEAAKAVLAAAEAPAEETPVPATPPVTNPETGAGTTILSASMLMALVLASAVVLKRKAA